MLMGVVRITKHGKRRTIATFATKVARVETGAKADDFDVDAIF